MSNTIFQLMCRLRMNKESALSPCPPRTLLQLTHTQALPLWLLLPLFVTHNFVVKARVTTERAAAAHHRAAKCESRVLLWLL
jgi:hypothetical protein